MDENREHETDVRPKTFTIPGALQILVQHEGTTASRQISNIDGFRIDPETNDLHFVQYNGQMWEKMLLKQVKLLAMRSVRDNPNYSTSHVIEFCYSPSLEKPVLTGIRIITSMNAGECEEIHYAVGVTTGDNIFRERRYYNAGIKSLQDIVQICKDELNHIIDTVALEAVELKRLLSSIGLLQEYGLA